MKNIPKEELERISDTLEVPVEFLEQVIVFRDEMAEDTAEAISVGDEPYCTWDDVVLYVP